MYTYDYNFNPFFGSAWLYIIALVVFVIIAVVFYARYIGGAPKRKSRLGRFFNFDYFYIERILKTFYMVLAVFVTIMCIFTPFGILISVSYFSDFGAGFGAFLVSIIGVIIAFLILQFILRIGFEWMMMFIRLVVDTRAIRNSVSGDPGSEVPPINSWKDTVENFGAEEVQEEMGQVPYSTPPQAQAAYGSPQPKQQASYAQSPTAPIPPVEEPQPVSEPPVSSTTPEIVEPIPDPPFITPEDSVPPMASDAAQPAPEPVVAPEQLSTPGETDSSTTSPMPKVEEPTAPQAPIGHDTHGVPGTIPATPRDAAAPIHPLVAPAPKDATAPVPPVSAPSAKSAPSASEAAPSLGSAPTHAGDSWKCNQCGKTNEGGHFCRHCGAPRA